MGKNIGQGASIALRQARSEDEVYADLHAFHAPSECNLLVAPRMARERRLMRARIKSVTGLKYRVFVEEMARRTSAKWVHFNLGHLP